MQVPMIHDVATVGNPFSYLWNLGYTRLCPVIPPNAPISERSSIHTRMQRSGQDPRGKVPGRKGVDGLWSGFNFVDYESAIEDCFAWAAMEASVGIKTGRGLLALDIDTTDRETAIALHALARTVLGDAPLRFGRKPKVLLLYNITEDVPYDCVLFSTPTEQDPKKRPRVEVLGEGRQFVAAGLHPATGRAYDWPQALSRREDLPTITPALLAEYMAAVEAKVSAPKRMISGDLGERGDINQDRLRGKPEVVSKAVNVLPNTTKLYEDRQSYLRVGYAIKAAMGPELEDEALDLYQQWASRWTEGEGNDPAIVEEDWWRMKPPFAVGARYLYREAQQHAGWTGRAEEYFRPVSVEEVASITPEAQGKRRLEILSVEDLMALPDPEYAIDRHIPEASLGFLYGHPGCGKSFIALDWSMHIAYGLPAWHGDAIKTRPGANVLYLAREGASGFKARIKAWQSKHLVPENMKPNFGLVRQSIDFMRDEDVDAVEEAVRSTGRTPLDLIVVDTVSRAIPGADENLQKEMTIFTKACLSLQDAFQCVVLGVHHAGKNGDIRGSTVLRADGDFVFKLEKRNPGFGRLTCEKQKDGPQDWYDDYAFESVGEGSLVPRRCAPGEVVEIEPSHDLTTRFMAAVSAAWDAGHPWSQFRQANNYVLHVAPSKLQAPVMAIKQIIDALTQAGLLVVEQKSARVRGYRILQMPTGDEGGLFE